MSWADLDKNPSGGLGAGSFIQFENGKTVKMRILDDEPHTTYVHKVSQIVGGQEVFRKISATEKADDNYILQNTNRWPAAAQFSMRALVHGEGGGIKILEGGPAIFKKLRAIMEENGSLCEYDITIRRDGEKKTDIEYTVSASPKSEKVDVDALKAQIAADSTLQWENVYRPTTGEQQKKILDDAKMDVKYDPAAKLMSELSLDKALDMTLTFGKHKDKKLRDLMISDPGYVEWAAANVTSNDQLAAACRITVQHLAAIQSGTAPQALPASTESTAGASTPPKSAGSADKASAAKNGAKAAPSAERKALLERANSLLSDMDAMDIVNAVKKASGGKTRVKDLTDDQLQALIASVSNE